MRILGEKQRQGLWVPWLASWLQGLSCFSPVENYYIKSSADEKTLAALSLSRIHLSETPGPGIKQ